MNWDSPLGAPVGGSVGAEKTDGSVGVKDPKFGKLSGQEEGQPVGKAAVHSVGHSVGKAEGHEKDHSVGHAVG